MFGRTSQFVRQRRVIHDREPSSTCWPVLGGREAIEASQPEATGHTPIQVAERCMSRIFDYGDMPSRRQECRHLSHLTEQMYDYHCVKRSPCGFQRLWIHRQEPWANVDEDRPMTRSQDGADKGRIRKQW